jgi:Sulfotransferase family
MRILIAGTHRCGSTWVANVLGQSPGIHNVFEPDSPYTDILGTVVRNRLGEYPALDEGEASSWYSMVWDLAFAGGWPWSRSPSARRLGRGLSKSPAAFRDHGVAVLAQTIALTVPQRQPHVIVKSANCGFSLEWIAQRYAPRVVIQRRNPLNIVSSWMALNIEPDPLDNAAVRRLWLSPLGLGQPARGLSRVGQVAWTVGVLTVALRESAERHPEWIVISHDDLSNDPYEGFTSLFAQLGLPWTPRVKAYLEAADDPAFVVTGANPRSHPNQQTAAADGTSRRMQQATQYQRRLAPAQVAEARAVLEDLPLGAWGVPPVEV